VSRDKRLAALEQRRAKAERAKDLAVSIKWLNAEGEVEIPPAGSDPLVRLNLEPGGGAGAASRKVSDSPHPAADELVIAPSTTTTSRSWRAPEPPAVTWCDGNRPEHCERCRTLDALAFARRTRRWERPAAVGLNYRPFEMRRAW
jgi:hypothetical protein